MKLHPYNTFSQAAMEIIFSLNLKVLGENAHHTKAAAKVLTFVIYNTVNHPEAAQA